MPRVPTKIAPWRTQIEQWIADGVTQVEIRSRLAQQGLPVSRTLLIKKLREWNVRVLRPFYEDSEQLRARVAHCFHSLRLSDKEAAQFLENEGFAIGPARVRRLRREMALLQRNTVERHEDVEGKMKEVLQKEFEEGTLENYQREKMYTYIRAKYNLVGRRLTYACFHSDRLYRVARQLNPKSVGRRRPAPARASRHLVVAQSQDYAYPIDPSILFSNSDSTADHETCLTHNGENVFADATSGLEPSVPA